MNIRIVILFWICILTVKTAQAEISWQEVSKGISNVKTVLINKANPKVIYIGTDKGVFVSQDNGNTWRNILSVRGANRTINYLTYSLFDPRAIYAATGSGLFYSSNQGQSWNKIFKGRDSYQSDCNYLAPMSDAIYLGTKSGLYVSKDKGRNWHKEQGKLGSDQIYNITYSLRDPRCIYVASLSGVFRTENSGNTWERIYVAKAIENSQVRDEEEDRDEDDLSSKIRYIVLDQNKPNNIYLATADGVYVSNDRGLSWQALSSYGLLSKSTQFLFLNDSELYSLNKSGVFVYKDKQWEELSVSLPSTNLNFLTTGPGNDLYVATDKGLFKTNLVQINIEKQGGVIAVYTKGEPGINSVQNAAIKYAEVDAEKIKRWRRQAAKKAILPQISVGMDRNSTDLWHWESGSSTKADDDCLRRGKDTVDWDISLSWDLSRLIWSDDQTSIDVRSRLTAQLRGDILDEVNKLYFERIRLKVELDNLAIEDRNKRFEKNLRIEELTASLDALTGGYFSKQIKEVKN